jgi:polyphosphate:AMP phosphotransferase
MSEMIAFMEPPQTLAAVVLPQRLWHTTAIAGILTTEDGNRRAAADANWGRGKPMFETAELGNTVDKEAYRRESEKTRMALLDAQKQLAGADFSVLIIIAGVEGAGKSETINLLHEWMDARGIQTHAFGEPSDEERERPRYWRYWRLLPPKGRMGIFFGSWYSEPILSRVFNKTTDADLDLSLNNIVALERMLSQENVLVLKFWMHLSKAAQKKRLKALEADKQTRWRVSKLDWKFFKKYDRFRDVSERAVRKTNTGEAPWHIVDAGDKRYRALAVTRTLLTELTKRLQQFAGKPKTPRTPPALPKPAAANVLNRLDFSLALRDKAYKEQLAEHSGRLARLARHLYDENRSLIVVFEGPDAAGKGGAIRRLTGVMDARNYQVISIAAPTEEERARPYLWRFWRHLPRLGRVTIFDRSWYGRVLVERIEGFCSQPEWQRAYAEINTFEEQVARFGIAIVKFWLAISPDEQLRRFKDREVTPYKQYKLTEEDWRNREKWGAYEAAACDMIEKTSTELAPWVLVEANDKQHARVKVLKNVCETIEKALDR